MPADCPLNVFLDWLARYRGKERVMARRLGRLGHYWELPLVPSQTAKTAKTAKTALPNTRQPNCSNAPASAQPRLLVLGPSSRATRLSEAFCRAVRRSLLQGQSCKKAGHLQFTASTALPRSQKATRPAPGRAGAHCQVPAQ